MINHLQDKLKAVFSDLKFDAEKHLYFWCGVRVKKSVTKLVEDHVPEFDEAYWLPRCAIKEGLTEHELKHKWQTINKEACELGTETHDFLEHYNGLKSPSTPQQKAGIQFLKDILVDYEIVAKELRMYSRKWGFAGTADLLLRHRQTGKLVIADYKTNKDIFNTYGLMLQPFQYLENHPYNHYQLQLSYYQLMLEEVSCSVSERLLVYLKADATYKIFPLVDFSSYLEDYLQTKYLKHENTY